MRKAGTDQEDYIERTRLQLRGPRRRKKRLAKFVARPEGAWPKVRKVQKLDSMPDKVPCNNPA